MCVTDCNSSLLQGRFVKLIDVSYNPIVPLLMVEVRVIKPEVRVIEPEVRVIEPEDIFVIYSITTALHLITLTMY